MTFVLAYGNEDVVGQVSDRRLTGTNGEPRILPENKATLITLADARLICGFAGLARVGGFRTGEWLLDAVMEASAETHLAHETVERLACAATERFRHKDIAGVGKARGMSLLLTGYRDVALPEGRHPLIAALITNFQNVETGQDEAPWDEFRVTYWSTRAGESNPTWIQRIGQWPAMSYEDEAKLRKALEQRRNPAVLDTMAVGLVREIAGRPLAAGTVGQELSSVQIGPVRPAQLDRGEFPIVGAFHPEGSTHGYRGVNQVISINDELQIDNPGSHVRADGTRLVERGRSSEGRPEQTVPVRQRTQVQALPRRLTSVQPV